MSPSHPHEGKRAWHADPWRTEDPWKKSRTSRRGPSGGSFVHSSTASDGLIPEDRSFVKDFGDWWAGLRSSHSNGGDKVSQMFAAYGALQEELCSASGHQTGLRKAMLFFKTADTDLAGCYEFRKLMKRVTTYETAVKSVWHFNNAMADQLGRDVAKMVAKYKASHPTCEQQDSVAEGRGDFAENFLDDSILEVSPQVPSDTSLSVMPGQAPCVLESMRVVQSEVIEPACKRYKAETETEQMTDSVKDDTVVAVNDETSARFLTAWPRPADGLDIFAAHKAKQSAYDLVVIAFSGRFEKLNLGGWGNVPEDKLSPAQQDLLYQRCCERWHNGSRDWRSKSQDFHDLVKEMQGITCEWIESLSLNAG